MTNYIYKLQITLLKAFTKTTSYIIFKLQIFISGYPSSYSALSTTCTYSVVAVQTGNIKVKKEFSVFFSSAKASKWID